MNYRVVQNYCNCHPETCCHWNYKVQIMVDVWIDTNYKSDCPHSLESKIKEIHPTWVKV